MATKDWLKTQDNQNKAIDCENANTNYNACVYEAAGVNKDLLDLELKYKDQEMKCDPEGGQGKVLNKPCTSNCTGVSFPFGILCIFKFTTKLSPRKFDEVDLCDHKCLTTRGLKGYKNCLLKCNKKVYEFVLQGEYLEEGYEYTGNDFSKKTKGNSKSSSLDDSADLSSGSSLDTLADDSSLDVVSNGNKFGPAASVMLALLAALLIL